MKKALYKRVHTVYMKLYAVLQQGKLWWKKMVVSGEGRVENWVEKRMGELSGVKVMFYILKEV